MTEWISVEDRLPNAGQPVGVCRTTHGGHVSCICFESEYINTEGKRFWSGSGADFYAEPTHWMPLPEPPPHQETNENQPDLFEDK